MKSLSGMEGRMGTPLTYAAGSKSLPLIALAGAATGAAISMQTRASLISLGAKSMLPFISILHPRRKRSSARR